MHETEASVVAAAGLQATEQGVSLAVSLELLVLTLFVGLCQVVEQAVDLGISLGLGHCFTLLLSLSYLLCGSLHGCEFLSLGTVDLLQEGHDLVGIVGGPEFQRSGTLEEFAHALRLLHARELHEDTAGAGNLLDVGLCHTELVDTALNYCVRVVDCALGLFAEELDDLVVGDLGLVGDIAAELVEVDVERETLLTGNLFPRLCEEGDEVGVGLLCTLTCQREGLVELIGGLFAGAVAHQLAEVQLQHDVHTALEVQTQVNLFLLYILVCVAEINLLGGYGVDVLVTCRSAYRIKVKSLVQVGNLLEFCLKLLCLYYSVCILCSFALLECCDQRKRELECAGQGDQNCH